MRASSFVARSVILLFRVDRTHANNQMFEYRQNARLARERAGAASQRPARVASLNAVPGTSADSARKVGAGLATARLFRQQLMETSSLDSSTLGSSTASRSPSPNIELDADAEDWKAVDSEFNDWMNHGIITDPVELSTYNPLAQWQVGFILQFSARCSICMQVDMHKYPILFSIALDVLPVQASAVPCERVFSSSKQTDTDRRSRLRHELFEVLQILKGLYAEDRLDFKEAWVPSANPDYNTLLTEWSLEPFVLQEYIEEGRIQELAQKISSSMQ